jgi:hypothetical protein
MNECQEHVPLSGSSLTSSPPPCFSMVVEAKESEVDCNPARFSCAVKRFEEEQVSVPC